jgi:hypothetical protein
MRRDGLRREYAIATLADPFAGFVSLNDQMGCSPFGAVMVTRMREPGRYTCPS